jgi:hypothetical protein
LTEGDRGRLIGSTAGPWAQWLEQVSGHLTTGTVAPIRALLQKMVGG